MNMDGLNVLGCHDRIGDDIFSTILKAGVSVAQGAVEEHQAGEEEAKKKDATHGKLEEAKAKDAQAATAIAHAIVSAALKSKTADSDSQSADKALSLARTARAGLSSDDVAALDSARQSQLAQAKTRAQASPNDGYKKALVTAWERVSTDGAGLPGDPSARSSAKESFFSRRVLGPFSGSAVLAGGGGLALAVGIAIFAGRK